MQRRRVHSLSDTNTVTNDHILIATIDESNGVNAHGLRASFITEPEVADANANGNWAIWCIPDEASLVPNTNTSALEAEDSNAFMWATGVYASSNQTPSHCDIELGTSRNCQRGARIVLVVTRGGVTTGSVRIRSVMTYFTKSL